MTDDDNTVRRVLVNPIIPIVLLVIWGVVTFGFSPAPGWIHLLLTVGMFWLIYDIVVRGDRTNPRSKS